VPSVVIAEDHPLTRTGLRAMLKGMDYDVVAEAEDGIEAVSIIVESGADLAIVDLGLPGRSGIAVTREVKKLCSIPILILTMSEAEQEVWAALSGGADGYCVKSASSNLIADAIRTIQAGGAFFDPRIAHVALRMLRQGRSQPKTNPLTLREMDILRLIAGGDGNAEIAERLSISVSTVKTHVAEILHKLSASDRAHAAAIALRSGILE
jgi:NarL family two-component system response regulator LiaR